MNYNLILTFLTVSCITTTNSLPNFIRGKYFQKLKLSGLRSFPDQYYNQRLDHYDESNIKTWKQVFNLSKFDP